MRMAISRENARSAAILASLCMGGASPAAAHASERGLIMLLPTEYYLIGGTLAVAASFLLLAAAPGRALRGLFREARILSVPLPRIETVTSLLSLAVLAALIGIGFTGTRDPLANPLPLTVWTVMWVGFTLLTAVVGNLWSAFNPWSGLVRLVGAESGILRLPAAVGYAPAIAGLIAFGWFELVSLAPEDPAGLATAVAAYWLVTFAAMILFGERDWLERGEFLSVFYRFISRFAPVQVWRDGPRAALSLAVPGTRLISGTAPTLSGTVFILCALAIVSFDGLMRTFWWLGTIDVNPLEFPGRSAVVAENTAGLIAACGLLTAAFFASVLLGDRMAAGTAPRIRAPQIARLALSIVPISLAYHFSHYLTVFLVNGQYALAAATDPLGTGADLLGLGDYRVTTSFLNTAESVETIWQVQSGAIVLGHIVAICVAHRMALDIWETPRKAAIGQIPLAVLMVFYTLFGLWLLASPTGA